MIRDAKEHKENLCAACRNRAGEYFLAWEVSPAWEASPSSSSAEWEDGGVLRLCSDCYRIYGPISNRTEMLTAMRHVIKDRIVAQKAHKDALEAAKKRAVEVLKVARSLAEA